MDKEEIEEIVTLNEQPLLVDLEFNLTDVVWDQQKEGGL